MRLPRILPWAASALAVIYTVLNIGYWLLDAYGNAEFAKNDAEWSWIRRAANPYYLVASVAIVAAVAVGVMAYHSTWVQNRLQPSSLRVSPQSGDALLLPVHGEMYCHLKVRNVGEFLPAVRARLTGVEPLWPQQESDGSQGYAAWPVYPYQPVYLRWSSREAATGSQHDTLDIPNDKTDHYLDVGVVDATDPTRFSLVTADDQDRRRYGRGWYRVKIALASSSRYPGPQAREDVFLLGLHPRDGAIPAPLVLYNWHPRGEMLMRGDQSGP